MRPIRNGCSRVRARVTADAFSGKQTTANSQKSVCSRSSHEHGDLMKLDVIKTASSSVPFPLTSGFLDSTIHTHHATPRRATPRHGAKDATPRRTNAFGFALTIGARRLRLFIGSRIISSLNNDETGINLTFLLKHKIIITKTGIQWLVHELINLRNELFLDR